MAHYIAIHKFQESVDLENLRACRRRLYRYVQESPVVWLGAWYIPSKNQMICEFEASTPRQVLRALEASGILQVAPLLLLEESVLMGPEAFPGEFGEEAEVGVGELSTIEAIG